MGIEVRLIAVRCQEIEGKIIPFPDEVFEGLGFSSDARTVNDYAESTPEVLGLIDNKDGETLFYIKDVNKFLEDVEQGCLDLSGYGACQALKTLRECGNNHPQTYWLIHFR